MLESVRSRLAHPAPAPTRLSLPRLTPHPETLATALVTPRLYVAASKVLLHFRLKARRSHTWLRIWASMARRIVKADHRLAAI
eukprot:3714555-Prymnesium_polylepis.1